VDQGVRDDEQRRVAPLARRQAEREGHVGFPRAGVPDRDHVLTVGDVLAAGQLQDEQLEHFGKVAAAHLNAVARGEDDRPVRPDRPRKSAGSETTYPRDLGTAEEVEAGVAALASEVWAWCERTGSFGRTVTVKLRYADFRTLTRSRTGAEPIASRAALAGAAVALVRGVFPLEKKVRLLGVAVSGFEAGGRAGDHNQIAFDFERPE
jgi:DNA polymerase-4